MYQWAVYDHHTCTCNYGTQVHSIRNNNAQWNTTNIIVTEGSVNTKSTKYDMPSKIPKKQLHKLYTHYI